MDLTISYNDLIARCERQESLWFAPTSDGGVIYWADAAKNDQDVYLLLPGELFQFVEDGERTLRVESLSFTSTNFWAWRVWVDSTVDLIIVEGLPTYPRARVFGPLNNGGMRFHLGNFGEISLAGLPNRIWYFVSDDGNASMASSWSGAVGLMV